MYNILLICFLNEKKNVALYVHKLYVRCLLKCVFSFVLNRGKKLHILPQTIYQFLITSGCVL